jgi:hypothetical protein
VFLLETSCEATILNLEVRFKKKNSSFSSGKKLGKACPLGIQAVD